MDHNKLTAAQIDHLGELFVTMLRAEVAEMAVVTLEEMEERLQTLSREIWGAVLTEIVTTCAQADETTGRVCPTCQQPMRCVDRRRERPVQGLIGDFVLRRAYWHCAACQQGQAPLDQRLGIGESHLSPRLARVVSLAGSVSAFGLAQTWLTESVGVRLTRELIRQTTEQIGAVAEADQQAAMRRAQRGEAVWPAAACRPCPAVLAVELDGVLIHTEGAWHEMKVGRVAPLGPQIHHDPETGRNHLALGASLFCAGGETAETFWWRLYALACQHGLDIRAPGTAVTVVVLGDGADWIWRSATSFLAVPGVEVVEIVDAYHAVQHLWTVGQAVYGEGPPAAAWVLPLKEQLLTQGVEPVLGALAELCPSTPTATTIIRQAQIYFTTHAARMDYPTFVARCWPIGSGAIESTCKTLIAAREKGAGDPPQRVMRWRGEGAQALASLRAVQASQQSTVFWQTHPLCRRRSLCPRSRCSRRVLPTSPVPANATPGPGTPLPTDTPSPAHPPTPLGDPVSVCLRRSRSAPRRPVRPAANHPWRHGNIGRPRSHSA